MRGHRETRLRHRRLTAQPHRIADVQILENRTLLAGNAVASLNGPHLTILGDGEANTVEITVIGANVVVRGLNNTTVNGSTGSFTAAAGSNTIQGNIYVSMGDGNDTVLFSRNVQIAGSTVVRGGDGNDSIGSTGANFRAGLWIHGNRGDDRISIQDSTVTGKLWIKTNQGADVISVEDTSVQGRLKIKTGNGDDAISVNTSTVTNKFSVHAGAGRDDVAVRASTFQSLVKMRTRSDADAVLLEGNTFRGPVKLNLGRNDDAVLLRAGNTFQRRFKAYSGDGNGDAVETINGNTFNSSQSIRKTESRTVSPNLISTRFDNATTGVIGKSDAADQFFTDLLANGPPEIPLDVSGNNGVLSTGGVFVTRDNTFDISGTAVPNSTITLDVDGDGQFDDGTTTADGTGNFTITATLQRKDMFGSTSTGNDELDGFHTIRVRATDGDGNQQNASTKVDLVENTVVQFVSTAGTFEVELFDALTPTTVSNFLNYLTRYTNMFSHRSVNLQEGSGGQGRIVQGGGFTINNGAISSVTTDAPITNEFSNQTSNIRRTISMALSGNPTNPDSGTSQWFFNIDSPTPGNNNNGTTFLDTRSHTVFGRVVGEGMTILDAIAGLPISDLEDSTSNGALTNVPLRPTVDALATQLTGTVSTAANSAVVTGVGTRFTQELTTAGASPGGLRSRIEIDGRVYDVQSIASDTSITISAPAPRAVTAQPAHTGAFVDSAFVRFSSIQEIL